MAPLEILAFAQQIVAIFLSNFHASNNLKYFSGLCDEWRDW